MSNKPDNSGRWTFPFTVPDGVSCYKRRGASGRSRWCIAYRPFRGGRRKVEAVSTDAKATHRRALEIARLLLEQHVDPRAARLAAAERKLVDTHLTEYEKVLLAAKVTEGHAYQVRSRAARVFKAAAVTRLSQILPSPVTLAIASMKDARAKDPDQELSAQTRNHYLRACKQFTAWLAGPERRLAEDLLKHLSAENVKTDRRHDRQDLGDVRSAALIEAARTGPDVLGMSGPDRAMLFETALETGFRAAELGTLTPARCLLDLEDPVLVVKAAYSKHREEDHQPIRRAFALKLRAYLAGRDPSRPIWTVPDEAIDLLRDYRTGEGDLKRAGIEYIDDEGRFADFHCLRHSFVCRMVRAGLNPKECQVLARHASMTTTMNYYAHLRLRDTAGAIARMPALPPSTGAGQQKATGTFGAQRDAQRMNVPRSPQMSLSTGEREAGGQGVNASDRGFSGGKAGEGELHLAGLEPATFGSVDPTPDSATADLSTVTGAGRRARSAGRSAPDLRAAMERVTAYLAAERQEGM